MEELDWSAESKVLIPAEHLWSKGLQFLKYCCGVFCELLDESSLHFWGNFGRRVTPEKVQHCSTFWPFVDNGSYCRSLESQSFRNGFITFCRLIDLNYFLSHLFLSKHFFTRATWVWILFSLHKKIPSFKNCMLCLLVLSLI